MVQGMRESGRAQQIASTIIETARQVNLDRDVVLPEDAELEMSMEQRDTVVGNVYQKLMEIESRLLPCGLHVVGSPPSAIEAIATLVNIAEIDRPDEVRFVLGVASCNAPSAGSSINDLLGRLRPFSSQHRWDRPP